MIVVDQTRPPADANPYTCRLLIRADALLYKLRGRRVYWASDGRLCERMPAGHGVELRTHFRWAPLWTTAARVQNRWPWTRLVLSL